MTDATGPRISSAELLAIELAAVRGWPALATQVIDGWLARSSSGGSVRANSVSALTYRGYDVDRSIRDVVAFYRARGAVARFTMTDLDQPAGLDAILAAAGFARHGDHVTMARDLSGPQLSQITSATPATGTSPLVVTRRDAASPGWMQVYLDGLSPGHRAVAPSIVNRIPQPCAFFEGSRDGVVIASGLSVIDGAVASVQCMATRAEVRRSGAATAILAAIAACAHAAGCRRLYLQADAANQAAISVYRRLGFTLAGRYHTREMA